MKFLLDTDHISILQKQSGAEYAALMTHIAQVQRSDLAFCIVSFHEQVLGCNAYLARAKTPPLSYTAIRCSTECCRRLPPRRCCRSTTMPRRFRSTGGAARANRDHGFANRVDRTQSRSEASHAQLTGFRESAGVGDRGLDGIAASWVEPRLARRNALSSFRTSAADRTGERLSRSTSRQSRGCMGSRAEPGN